MKRCVVDAGIKFKCGGYEMPALSRSMEWKYLGISFTAEGKTSSKALDKVVNMLSLLAKAPLKPQQRLFALRTFVLPSVSYSLILGRTNIGYLRKIDAVVRKEVRKWLDLPHDSPSAYIHADYKDGGLSVPSARWSIPEMRMRRLHTIADISPNYALIVMDEIEKCRQRLNNKGQYLDTHDAIKKYWASRLYSMVDGKGLQHSSDVPQQHRWTIEGNRFLQGRDFLQMCRLRINALPTRSRCARGRPAKDRRCRAGCNAVETLNYIQQICHRTHPQRIKRHDAIAKYVTKKLEGKGFTVLKEPRINTEEGLRKPDIVAYKEEKAYVIDAQVINDQFDLNRAHENKKLKYASIAARIRELTNSAVVNFGSITLSWKGVWSARSLQDLLR